MGNFVLPGYNLNDNAQAGTESGGLGLPAGASGAPALGGPTFLPQNPAASGVRGSTSIMPQGGRFVSPFAVTPGAVPSAATIGTGVGPAPTVQQPEKPFAGYDPVPTTVNPLYYLLRPDSAFSPVQRIGFPATFEHYRMFRPLSQQQQQTFSMQGQLRNLQDTTRTQNRTIQQLQQQTQQLQGGGTGGTKGAGYMDYYDYYPGLRR